LVVCRKAAWLSILSGCSATETLPDEVLDYGNIVKFDTENNTRQQLALVVVLAASSLAPYITWVILIRGEKR